MRFNTQVEELIWDLERKVWTAKCSNDFVVEAPFVISAVGQLNRPLYPKGIGLDEIDPRKMTVFHSSSWDHKCDLKGKRVAIVGNGASALQFSPHVIDQAKEVLIFYRSSSYYLPKWDSAVPKYIRKLLLSFPILNRLYRYFIYLLFDIRSPMLLNTAKEWQKWITEHTFIAYMKGKLKREDLRKSLIPDYVVGCKRVLLDDRYLEAIQSENVKMVQESVSKISNNSITTNAGNTFENIDVVIFGTGFDSISFLAPIKILGKDKTDLHAQWDGSPSAYFGLAVPNFPNFFLTYGPHTNLGHSSIVFMMECQTEYAAAMISHCLDSGKKSFELKQSSYDAYMKIFEKRIAKTVFAGNCSSWYKNKDGKVVNNWYGSCTEYWLLLRSPDYNAYNFQ
jgi:cation diffusion facilitator CzcD-associated flavoprotein CzcO